MIYAIINDYGKNLIKMKWAKICFGNVISMATTETHIKVLLLAIVLHILKIRLEKMADILWY